MEQTLKITSVLSDPTRYYIYQFILNNHREVTVQDIADQFEIHPNVARLHLSKLEDVKMIVSESKKTGKGGRPSRLYRLSDEVIQLHFPFRDYQLLARISLQAISSLGEQGNKALEQAGKAFGQELIQQKLMLSNIHVHQLSFQDKVDLLNDAAKTSGFSPEFHATEEDGKVFLQVFNCPFKELAIADPDVICNMHNSFLMGMFESVFENVEITEFGNMFSQCEFCAYKATITK
jgi:predicted ArsR family transcriptional regulator